MARAHDRSKKEECQTVNRHCTNTLCKVESINYHLWSVSIHLQHRWQNALVVDDNIEDDDSCMAIEIEK